MINSKTEHFQDNLISIKSYRNICNKVIRNAKQLHNDITREEINILVLNDLLNRK